MMQAASVPFLLSTSEVFMKEEYFDNAIEFDGLYKGLKKSCRNVRWKDSVIKYEANALTNTLANASHGDTYKIREGMKNFYSDLVKENNNERRIETGKN